LLSAHFFGLVRPALGKITSGHESDNVTFNNI
jgi:hypothetical protein